MPQHCWHEDVGNAFWGERCHRQPTGKSVTLNKLSWEISGSIQVSQRVQRFTGSGYFRGIELNLHGSSRHLGFTGNNLQQVW